jgi:DNA-binding CsgD family transcriptional regulator
MVNSLHPLFQELATAPTEQELRFRFMDGISEHFGIQRWGIYLLDAQKRLASFDVKGVSDAFVERYEQIGKSVDPVLKYVLEYHAPAHEELVLPVEQWKHSELYKRCCVEYSHEHIMTGPIVGNGDLIGTIHFARVGDVPAFCSQDLANLSAVCLHISACLAKLQLAREHNLRSHFNLFSPDQFQSLQVQNSNITRLTPREIQIANLVAKGLTNAEIGKELWVTSNTIKQALKRLFRKLGVASRTEMVAQLRDILQR